MSIEAMNWRNSIREWFDRFPRWLWLAASVVLPAVVLAIFFSISRDTDFPAVLTLLGVIIGGVIAAGTNLITAQANRQAQIVATTWSRRIVAHQVGFAWWWRITDLVYKPKELGPVILEAHDWWVANCLYLSEQAQKEFKMMPHLAKEHNKIVDDNRGVGVDGARIVQENMDKIVKVGQILTDGADRHLSQQVLEDLRGKVPQ